MNRRMDIDQAAAYQQCLATVEQLSKDVRALDQEPDPWRKIEGFSKALRNVSPADFWNRFITLALQSNPEINFREEVSAPRIQEVLNASEKDLSTLIPLVAVGMLGLTRIYSTALTKIRSELDSNEFSRGQAEVNDVFHLLERYLSLNITIHGDPCHWQGELAQDRANAFIKSRKFVEAKQEIVKAISRWEPLTESSDWDHFAWKASKSVLLVRLGQATKNIDHIQEGIDLLESIYKDYPNADRLRAFADIMIKTAVKSVRLPTMIQAVKSRRQITHFLRATTIHSSNR